MRLSLSFLSYPVESLALFNRQTFSVASNIQDRLKLKSFQKFDSATAALEEVASVVEGKVTPRLASLLDEIKDEKKVSLAVADPKLGRSDRGLHTDSVIDLLLRRKCHWQASRS